jgi:hypothetical protein
VTQTVGLLKVVVSMSVPSAKTVRHAPKLEANCFTSVMSKLPTVIGPSDKCGQFSIDDAQGEILLPVPIRELHSSDAWLPAEFTTCSPWDIT